jgi:hypothetical protein
VLRRPRTYLDVTDNHLPAGCLVREVRVGLWGVPDEALAAVHPVAAEALVSNHIAGVRVVLGVRRFPTRHQHLDVVHRLQIRQNNKAGARLKIFR